MYLLKDKEQELSMKRKLQHILVLIVVLPLMLLTSCVRIPGLGTGTPKPTPSESQEAEAASFTPSPVPTDWHSGVQTDYSGLTPYKPIAETYTKLKDGAMPALVPSGQYGELMPYVGETMYADNGYSIIRKFGLVTKSGMIVTDPVYSNIYQGYYYNNTVYTSAIVPAYHLVHTLNKINEDNPWDSEVHAVCASDGSWTTKFEYEGISFYENAIMLVRSYENNDIDIMDYNGKLLYNTTSLSCFSDLPDQSSYSFMSGYGEGVIMLALSSGGTVFIDLVTGKETFTEYTQCSAFSGGLAATYQNGLFGYINKEYAIAIPPQYIWADYFTGGKAIVQLPDRYAVIDQSGNILLENPYSINKWDSSSYSVVDADNNVTYYDSELRKVAWKQAITPLNDGWFYYTEGSAVTVFRGNEKHIFRAITGIGSISGGLATVYKNDNAMWQEGVMTLDGDVVIPMTESLSIYLTSNKNTNETYAIASAYDSRQSFTVYNEDGEVLFRGNGYASYNAQYDLFEVNDERSFAYVNTNGNDVFRLSLLKYLPD